MTYTYQWRRRQPSGVTIDIPGAAGTAVPATPFTYTKVADDVGCYISVRVTRDSPLLVKVSNEIGPIEPASGFQANATWAIFVYPDFAHTGYSYVMTDPSRTPANVAYYQDATTKVLQYRSGQDIDASTDITVAQGGVLLADARSHGWVLKDGGANEISTGFGNVLANVGDAGYQAKWCLNVAAQLAATGCNGCFIDNCHGSLTASAMPVVAGHTWTQSEWADAMASFMTFVGAYMRSRGYYVITNSGYFVAGDPDSDNGVGVQNWYTRVGGLVDGLCNEFWLQANRGNPVSEVVYTSNGTYPTWPGWQAIQGIAQAAGSDFFAIHEIYDSSAAHPIVQRYGKGSFLLDWNGTGGGFAYHIGGNFDPWTADWTYPIGTPTAAKTQPQTNVYRRAYTNGIVIVNTNGSGSVTQDGHVVAAGDAYIGP